MASALVILKPDASHRLAVRDALWGWLRQERGWKLAGLTWFQPPAELIEQHYDFLQRRPFFPWLVDFMSALPLLLGKVDADPQELENMRYELGETRIHEARPGSLRERFGIWGGVNCLHLSDSPESGEKETKLWAGHLDLAKGDARPEPRAEPHPDHTFHLRSLFNQVAADTHRDLAMVEIKKLLREESDLTGDRFDALCRVMFGATG
ncbi:MAG: nucleoside-diphosphate kinase [Chloroflexota bacterium]